MTEKRITETFAHGRIAYPQFEAEEIGNADRKRRPKTASHERMNQFYRALRDAAAAYIEEIAQAADGTSRIYTAEYTLRWEEDSITVEYVLRLRRRGRIEVQKKLIHTWKNGWLIPPEKKKHRRGTQKRKTRLKQGAKDDII